MFSPNLRSKLLVLLLGFVLPFFCTSQVIDQKSLREILAELEGRFEVSFSYQDQDVAGLALVAPEGGRTLQESLDFIEAQTGLNFQQLNEEFIAIVKSAIENQRVCGFIIAADRVGGLSRATVESQGQSTVSDEVGFFSLEGLSEDAIISIRYLGYETQYFSKQDLTSGCKEITMVPSIASLPEVTILNYFTRGVDRTIDGTLVVHPKNQQLLPGVTEPDVLYSIQALPGIQSIDETVSNLNIRGGTNDQNLVLWEGIRMFQTGHFFGLISAFNPYFHDQVQITTNGTPARYGNATSGTIDMQSTDEIPDKISGSAGLGLNMINGDINLRIPVSPKTALKFSARRAITDVVETPTFDRYFNRAFENTEVVNATQTSGSNSDHSFRFYDISSRLNHYFSDSSHVSLSLMTISNKLEFNEVLQGPAPDEKTSTLDQQSQVAGLAYRKDWSKKLSTFLSTSFSNYKLNAVNFDLPNDQRLLQENQVTNYVLQLRSNLKLENLDLETGLVFDEIGIESIDEINNPDFSRVVKDVVTTYAGFAQASFVKNNSKLTVGVRGNFYQGLEEFRVEPRLSFARKLNTRLSIEVLGELKSQVATQIIDLQTDFLGVEKRRWVLANGQDLPIVQSKNLSIGTQYKEQNLLLSLSAYTREVEGITTSSQGFLNQFQLIREPGSYRVSGLEFLATYSFERFKTWINTSILNNNYSFPTLAASDFPSSLDVRHSTSLGLSYESGPVELSLGLNSRSGRPFTPLDTNNPLSGEEINYLAPNSELVDSYFRMDFSANYKFELGKNSLGHVGLSFWNLTNRDNVLSQYYQLQDGEVVALQQKALAFTPNLIFRTTF